MKKVLSFFLVVFIGLTAAIDVFAEEEQNRHDRHRAIHFDPVPLINASLSGGFGISGGFEYALHPQLSGKAKLHYLGIPTRELSWVLRHEDGFFHSLRLQAEGRFYPFANSVQRLFVNGGLQFQRGFGSFEVSGAQYNGSNSAGFYLGLGHKFVIGNHRYALLVEPVLEYVHSIHFGLPTEFDFLRRQTMLGIHGFRFALNFGVTFP